MFDFRIFENRTHVGIVAKAVPSGDDLGAVFATYVDSPNCNLAIFFSRITSIPLVGRLKGAG